MANWKLEIRTSTLELMPCRLFVWRVGIIFASCSSAPERVPIFLPVSLGRFGYWGDIIEQRPIDQPSSTCLSLSSFIIAFAMLFFLLLCVWPCGSRGSPWAAGRGLKWAHPLIITNDLWLLIPLYKNDCYPNPSTIKTDQDLHQCPRRDGKMNEM